MRTQVIYTASSRLRCFFMDLWAQYRIVTIIPELSIFNFTQPSFIKYSSHGPEITVITPILKHCQLYAFCLCQVNQLLCLSYRGSIWFFNYRMFASLQ